MSVTVRTGDTPIGERDPRPIVATPRRRVPGAMIAAVALLAALLLFLLLASQRQSEPYAASGDDQGAVAYAPPPPLVVPSDTVPQPQYVPLRPSDRPRRRRWPSSRRLLRQCRRRSANAIATRRRNRRSSTRRRQPERIVAQPPRGRAASGEPALVLDTSAEIPIGTLIPAVLETPIDTSRPGFARAIVTRDARGIDGQRVIVPRGSRLIGEYQSDVRGRAESRAGQLDPAGPPRRRRRPPGRPLGRRNRARRASRAIITASSSSASSTPRCRPR